MDFITPKRRRFVWKDAEISLNIYTHDLQMYKKPPENDISFEEFQQIAVERLKVLQLVESINSQGLHSAEDKLTALHTALKKEGFTQFAKLLYGKGCESQNVEDLEARRRDCHSHFTLRLAFGMKEELRPWFAIQETELFKWRFTSLNREGVINMLSIYDFDFKPISIEEKNVNIDNLYSSSSREVNVHSTDFYKLPYLEVLDLVSTRKVFIKSGMAYVPQTELNSVFVSSFKKDLIDDLENVPHYIANIRYDDRLINFLKNLPDCFSGMSRVIWSSEVTPISMIEELSKSSFPLCMRVLHEQLLANSHLRHGGRLTYGLFLKGIGVTLDDAIIFWKDIFMKGKERDKFDKNHKYTLRHMYGQEGKKTNYTPYSCGKVINAVIGPGEYHGCPYKYMDSQALKTRLNDYHLPLPQINEIVGFAKKGEYLNACKKYFEVTHGRVPERMFVHPNGYFNESRLIHNGPCKDTQKQQQTQTSNTHSIENETTYSSPAVKPKTEIKDERRNAYITPSKKSAAKKLDIEQMLNDDDLDDFSY